MNLRINSALLCQLSYRGSLFSLSTLAKERESPNPLRCHGKTPSQSGSRYDGDGAAVGSPTSTGMPSAPRRNVATEFES